MPHPERTRRELLCRSMVAAGSRLYFSSQNRVAGDHTEGRIYEVRGPFFIRA